MFNQVTLILQITLLIALYLFLLLAIRAISKDLSSVRGQPQQGSPRLIVMDGEGIGARGSVLVVEQVVIGRSPDCDIVLDDTFASAQHARVFVDGSQYWLEDLGSTNGTFVKGTRIEKPVQLARGSRFKIGQTVFKFME